jgi:hypothetical protein
MHSITSPYNLCWADQLNAIAQLQREIQHMIAQHETPDSPTLTLHREEINVLHHMTVLLEYGLFAAVTKPCEDESAQEGPDPFASARVSGTAMKMWVKTLLDTNKPQSLLPVFEQICKLRERLRKELVAMEAHCGKMGRPVATCLADRMLPILETADGVIEEALHLGPAPNQTWDGYVQEERTAQD